MYRAENRPMDSLPAFRFVTGALQVSYLKPTPLGPLLEIRGRALSLARCRSAISSRRRSARCWKFAAG